MESPDVVDTSDVEERDVLTLSEHVDLSSPLRNVSTSTVASPRSIIKINEFLCRQDIFLSPAMHHDRFNDDASPQKRIKLSHDRGSASPNPPHEELPAGLSILAPLDCDPPFVSLRHDLVDATGGERAGSCSSSHPRSLSISSDHNSLFSPPCNPATPPQISSRHSYNQLGPAEQKLHSLAMSPLTPISSPALPQTFSQSPDPIRLSSENTLESLPPSSREINPVCLFPAEMPEDPHPSGRYSLRRREAWQLNPYAYDKLMYKQQLKSHPDAIVKFRSPRRCSGPGGVAESGTQDEFVFPLDNPDEDNDYVDAVAENNRRKRKRKRVHSFQRNDNSEDNGPGLVLQMDEGWLPEILKEPYCSDEDNSEIQKFAKKVRKECEKAAAKSSAEIGKTTAGALVAAKKSTRRRPKPFPMHEDTEDEAVYFPEYAPRIVRPRSPSMFSGAQLEPMTSPSPSRSSSRPHAFDDHNCEATQNHFSVDHNYSVPPSPSKPPPTPDASALLSNASGIDSESDRSSTFELYLKDRQQIRALKRVMPNVMVSRLLATDTARRPPPRARFAAELSGSEAEEVRVVPGIARVRRGRYKDVEVRGDSESSDVEPPTEAWNSDGNAGPGAMEVLSSGQSATGIRRTRYSSPRPTREDVISLSDSSISGSSLGSGSDFSDDEKTHQSLFDRPVRGPTHERSLIDWMLCRTGDSDRSKSKCNQPTRRRKPRGSRTQKLNIVTGGARRYTRHQQTLLPFVKANASSNTTSLVRDTQGQRDQHAQSDQDESVKWKKKRKQSSRSNQGPIYNVHHDATRITSKHRETKVGGRRATLIIDNHDNEFRQALDPGWRAEVERWNKPDSPAPQPATNLGISKSRLFNRISPKTRHEIPLPYYFRSEEEMIPSIHRHIVVDMDISPLPSGVKFGTSSYIGKGLLFQLISVASGDLEVVRPVFCNLQGFEIGPTTSAAVFSALLGPLCDCLANALYEFKVGNLDTMQEWESVMYASGQLLSLLVVHAEDQEFVALEEAFREYSDGLLRVLDSHETNIFTLTTHWFVVELAIRLAAGIKYRQGSVEARDLVHPAKQLIRHLMHVDLRPAFSTFRAMDGDVEDTSLPHRAAELWICLIHVLPCFQTSSGTVPGHLLWRLLTDLYPESSPTGAEASEDIWRMIFSLCAISQFSVHGLSTSVFRLSAAWELVASALKKIALAENPKKEHQFSQRALRKRDEYVSYVVTRCFLLWRQWGWRLDEGLVMFKSLHEIFRSRNFANLLIERSAPMGFLENGDVELLSKQDPRDSVFEVFLKMVVQAVSLLNANVELDPKQRSGNVRKLLQMAVPVSPVPFSRSAPPSVHTLSMLVNRFSAMAIAIYLDPTCPNVKFRTGQARRCVNFKDADDHSRVACVYGMMNFAMIVKHHNIIGGLGEVLGWLGEMADVLMDEYNDGGTGVARKKTTTLIQLLIGSVRRVIETQSLDRGQDRAEYPEPELLDGPWVTRVFNPRTDLVTIQQTGVEIRMLVQSFLDARTKALPDVRPQPPPSVESQESQDEYDKMHLNLNDEELLAVLGEKAKAIAIADLKSKESALCKVLDKSITPAVYRLVCRYLGESDNTSAKAADEWIDCWVGCANVLVQNNYRDWGLYMKLGQQSWEKIINGSWRHRVGLRFNLTLLRLDPGAYQKLKDEFISVLLEAMLSHRTTIEHEFVSVVLTLDGLKYPLLRGAPLDPVPGTRRYDVGPDEYETVRERLIQVVFSNAAACLRTRVDAESQMYAESVVSMLSTMQNVYEELTEDKAGYVDFGRRVVGLLSGHPELALHPRVCEARRAWDLSVHCMG